MKHNISALFSEYVIDGVPMELTPAMILDSCLAPRCLQERCPAAVASEEDSYLTPHGLQETRGAMASAEASQRMRMEREASSSAEGKAVAFPAAASFATIVDETLDPGLCSVATDASKVKTYLKMVRDIKARKFSKFYAGSCTRAAIARALTDVIWRGGHFRLGDLAVRLDWIWPTDHVGDFAAFYESVSAAAEYIDSLGLKVSDYSFVQTAGDASLQVSVSLSGTFGTAAADEFFSELPFKTAHPRMDRRPLHPSKLVPDAQSWLIYVPFDDSDYRLSGSLLAQALGISGPAAPQIGDADYFIDCYEVVRELVEDGIILSGTTVGDGGLISAVKSMTSSKVGASVELSDLVRATGEKDIIRLLFSEVPGAIFQIADIDFDYVDAELLLQDVAFYSLGHPLPGSSELRVHASEKSGIQVILESIIRSQNSEGED